MHSNVAVHNFPSGFAPSLWLHAVSKISIKAFVKRKRLSRKNLGRALHFAEYWQSGGGVEGRGRGPGPLYSRDRGTYIFSVYIAMCICTEFENEHKLPHTPLSHD